jgi:iron(III) transport system substrate-binding protein
MKIPTAVEQTSIRRRQLAGAGRIVVAAMILVFPAKHARSEPVIFPAAASEKARILIDAATDLIAIEPMIRDFQVVAPDVAIEYVEYVSNDLFSKAVAQCSKNEPGADLFLSSSVDQLVKLANDGCGSRYRSITTDALASPAKWRDEVFGFTSEPAALVYNRDMVPNEDVPHTRTELLDLLRRKSGLYAGRIGSYDIAQSGIGYLLASTDARNSSLYGRLIESFGRAGLVTRCCTADIIKEIEAGHVAIGYNLLASYALVAQRRGARIGVVLLRDYTLVLSRGAMIPRTARDPRTAARFLEYLLSERGQKIAREGGLIFDLQMVRAMESSAQVSLSGSEILRPIAIGPSLLAEQDQAKRARFLAEWRRSMAPPTP